MASSVQIDFSRPIALFPLPSVVVYPHTAEWIVAFEPRYRQLVEDCLRAHGDGPLLDAAPIAMATYAGRSWSGERIGERGGLIKARHFDDYPVGIPAFRRDPRAGQHRQFDPDPVGHHIGGPQLKQRR